MASNKLAQRRIQAANEAINAAGGDHLLCWADRAISVSLRDEAIDLRSHVGPILIQAKALTHIVRDALMANARDENWPDSWLKEGLEGIEFLLSFAEKVDDEADRKEEAETAAGAVT